MGEYDAIVIGAGPGGSTAAYFLAQAGARVLVIEKKAFPRAKTCGDGLTPRAAKVLQDLELGPQLESYQRVRGLRVIGMNQTLEMEFPRLSNFPAEGYVRPRKDLDSDIAARARAAGAEFMMSTEATAPIFDGLRLAGVKWIRKRTLETGGVAKVAEGAEYAPFTIIADGASSPFGRALGIRKETWCPMGLAIRTYYLSDRDKDDLFESWLELRNGDELLPGYGWIFPVGDGTVNIGVGLLSTFGKWRNVNLNHLQRAFIDMLPASYGITHESQTEPYQSGRLPMGGSVIKPFGPGYLLIGDAAGMVNPFNGEGIAYALETGKLSAGIVAEALDKGKTVSLIEYHTALNDIYGGYYRIGRKFAKIIGSPRIFHALCSVGLRSQTLMEFVFQVLANLGEDKGGGLGDRVIRAMGKFADHELDQLKDPDIPMPPRRVAPRQTKVGAA